MTSSVGLYNGYELRGTPQILVAIRRRKRKDHEQSKHKVIWLGFITHLVALGRCSRYSTPIRNPLRNTRSEGGCDIARHRRPQNPPQRTRALSLSSWLLVTPGQGSSLSLLRFGTTSRSSTDAITPAFRSSLNLDGTGPGLSAGFELVEDLSTCWRYIRNEVGGKRRRDALRSLTPAARSTLPTFWGLGLAFPDS